MSKLTRDVTRNECPWLVSDIPAGTEVDLYAGCTYGCIGAGVAVNIDDGPFFEVPRDALPAEMIARAGPTWLSRALQTGGGDGE